MIIITGGAGFIGSNLAAALEARGVAEIAVVDRLGPGEKWRNIAKRELAAVVHPDRSMDFLDSNGAAVKAILHMGAVSSSTESDADVLVRNNFELSLALWSWCARRGARLIYASSAATYGDGSSGFEDDGSIEGLRRLRPLNAYGWSKHLFDRRVARLVASGAPSPPQWVGLKLFNVYGPNEYHKGAMQSVVAQVHARAASGEPARLFKSHRPDYPDGGQARDFVWIDDCVRVVLWCLDHPEVSGLFNLGTGRARSFADLAAAVYRALGKEPRIEYVDTPPSLRARYQYFTQADMRRLSRAGYGLPFTELEDGVLRYVHDHLSQADPYR